MYEKRPAFGERAVVLAEPGGRLPGRVLLPGRGATVAERADRARDPVATAKQARVARMLGAVLATQDETDIAAEDRLFPPTDAELAYGSAALDLSLWRGRVERAVPGAALAALLTERPSRFEPAPGFGAVQRDEFRPLDAQPHEGDLWPNAVLTGVVTRERLISYLRAEQYRDLAELSGCYPGIHQFLATEVALALHVTEAEAAAMLGIAEALRDRLPDTLARLSSGAIDESKALAMVNATMTTTAEVARAVEQQILPEAPTVTATTVRRRAGRAVIALDPDGAGDRHRKARVERFVSRRVEADGMARLSVYAPTQDVATIWEAITCCADILKQSGDDRSLGNRRVDALAMVCGDILGAGGWKNLRLPDKHLARPRINVTVPYTVLLGHRAPCELAGYGPIPTEQALPLIGAGDLYRIVCDPLSGMMLNYGRTRYRPPPHLAEFVRLRDGECPMPCCHHPAQRGHLDHIVPARPDPVTGLPTQGTTDADNLAPPCGHHHLSKDAERGFTLRRDTATGTYTWTTPLGRSYSWAPEPRWHPHTDAIPGEALAERGPGGCDGECCGYAQARPPAHARDLDRVDDGWAGNAEGDGDSGRDDWADEFPLDLRRTPTLDAPTLDSHRTTADSASPTPSATRSGMAPAPDPAGPADPNARVDDDSRAARRPPKKNSMTEEPDKGDPTNTGGMKTGRLKENLTRTELTKTDLARKTRPRKPDTDGAPRTSAG